MSECVYACIPMKTHNEGQRTAFGGWFLCLLGQGLVIPVIQSRSVVLNLPNAEIL